MSTQLAGPEAPAHFLPCRAIVIEIVSTTPLLRHGLAELLRKVPGFQVHDADAPSPELGAGTRPCTTILITDDDEDSPDALVEPILSASPRSKVIVLTDSGDHLFLGKVLTSGAHACLAKRVQLDELVSTIMTVHREDGRFVLSAPVEAVRRLRPGPAGPGALTNRETEILRLVAAGMRNRHISRRLFITEATVKRHLTNIYGKLEVTSRAEAVRKVVESDLLRD